MAVQQALFNLANLDLYLGRYARAGASIERLAEQRDKLSPNARAQLLGLAGRARDAHGRHRARRAPLRALRRGLRRGRAPARRRRGAPRRHPHAARRRRSSAATVDVTALARELDALRAKLGDGGLQRARAARRASSRARSRSSAATRRSRARPSTRRSSARTRAGQREWAWRALDARARLASSQGAFALARRDTERRSRCSRRPPRSSRAISARSSGTIRAGARSGRRTPRRCPRSRRSPGRHRQRLAVAARSTACARSADAHHHDRAHARSGISSMGAPLPAEDRLARIFEITRDLAREHDLDRLLQRVTDHAVGLLGAERGLIVARQRRAASVVAHTARDSKGEEARAELLAQRRRARHQATASRSSPRARATTSGSRRPSASTSS